MRKNFLVFLIFAILGLTVAANASTVYSRYFSALARYNAGEAVDDRDLDGEFDAMTIALNRKVLCAGSAPSSPIAGQTWVDTTNKLLKIYRNNEWINTAPVYVGATNMTTAQAGDLWYNTSSYELKTYNGTVWTGVVTGFSTLTEKTALVVNDTFIIEDSAASNAKKKVKLENITWPGSVVQVLEYYNSTNITVTTQVPYDDTIPQSNEGGQVMTFTVSPKSATNKLMIDVLVNYESSYGRNACALFQNSSANALAAVVKRSYGDDYPDTIHIRYNMSAGVAAPIIFNVTCGPCGDAGNFCFNGDTGGRVFGGKAQSSITVTEIKQ